MRKLTKYIFYNSKGVFRTLVLSDCGQIGTHYLKETENKNH